MAQSRRTETVPQSVYRFGEMVRGKGIYVGLWKPAAGKVFDAYTSPEDITDAKGQKILLAFNLAAYHVGQLRGWHDHDGYRFDREQDVMLAVQDNPAALRQWFIPTLDMVKNHLYENKDKGNLRDTFAAESSSDGAHTYLSCTEHAEIAHHVRTVDLTDGHVSQCDKFDRSLSVRPFRAELR